MGIAGKNGYVRGEGVIRCSILYDVVYYPRLKSDLPSRDEANVPDCHSSFIFRGALLPISPVDGATTVELVFLVLS
jgi:hypothetical protein